MIKIW